MPKKKPNYFLRIITILFIIFMGLYVANISGYYESKIRDKVIVTEEGIREFENKVQMGEEIDVTSYLNNTREDYSSKLSNLGEEITNNLEGFVSESAKIIKDILKSLF